MRTYTCRLPGNWDVQHPFPPRTASYACRGSCTTDPCWRVSGATSLTMVCPNDARLAEYQGKDGELVQVTNSPAASVAATKNPLESHPWSYRLSTNEYCNALGPNKLLPRHDPPIFGYVCGEGTTGPLFTGGPIDRSSPTWTIGAAPSAEDARAGNYPLRVKITDAWFIGNGSRATATRTPGERR